MSLALSRKKQGQADHRRNGPLVSEMLAYCYTERSHQAKGNDPLVLATSAGKPKRKKVESHPDAVPISQIACRDRLGGLLSYYHRRAA